MIIILLCQFICFEKGVGLFVEVVQDELVRYIFYQVFDIVKCFN